MQHFIFEKMACDDGSGLVETTVTTRHLSVRPPRSAYGPEADCRPLQALVDLLAQEAEIDGFGK
jgi:hypothetical protein